MTLTCRSFRVTSRSDGKIDLEIEGGMPKPLYIPDLVARLRKTRRTIHRMSRRMHNRLPLVRGKGRPFITEEALSEFLAQTDDRRYL
jgi:hypothetical protein